MTNEALPPRPAGDANTAEPDAALPQASVGGPTPVPPRPRRRRQVLGLLAAVVLLYVAVAYLVMPMYWKRYTGRHPSLDDIPGVTFTGSGLPADPLNVALVGTDAEVVRIMLAAKWYPADPLTLRSCLRIASASV